MQQALPRRVVRVGEGGDERRPGVVHDRADWAEVALGGRERRVDGGGIADVRGVPDRGGAGGPARRDGVVERRAGEGDERHGRARPREALGRGAADARARAGDEGGRATGVDVHSC